MGRRHPPEFLTASTFAIASQMTQDRCFYHISRATVCVVAIVQFGWTLLSAECDAAAWSIAPISTIELNTSAVGFSVGEMSGVTYIGPAPEAGKHRFLTVQDNGNGIVTFDASFNLNGGLVAAQAVSNQLLSASLDFEGIVQVGDSVFLSEENGPGVREYNPQTGAELQSVSIPSLFTDNSRNNRGFESLAYDQLGTKLWTANEEALSIDGPLATSTAGTTVRLLELAISGQTITAGSQYAYEVEPIHGLATGSARSGLVELVSMPDGTLIGLERSAALALPGLLNRIFEIDFSTATDVSAAAFEAGLDGATYSPVGKELLWTGAIGSTGQNLEGLTVGPRLPNGDWILLGVVDSGDSFSSNTIFAMQATPLTPIAMDPDTADFDQDSDRDGADFLAWQRGFGVTSLAGLSHGDANHSGTVTADDLAIWDSQYGPTPLLALQAVPEPTSLALLFLTSASLLARRR